MVRIGIVGLGFMGKTHFDAISKVDGARVEAICTRSEKKLGGDWSEIQGNFGGPGGFVDLSEVTRYRRIDELLADGNVDLVDICLPTSLHRDATLAALSSGKHVLVEKPIAVRLDVADELVAAADGTDRHFLVAQVLRFWPEFAYVKRAIESGTHGHLLGMNLKRIISAPTWGDDWFSDLEASGGPGIDLHIHDSDFVRFAVGMPDAVFSTGILVGDEFAQYVSTQYIFDDRDVTVTAQSGAIVMAGRPFEHGFDAYFEHGTLQYNSSWERPPSLVTADGVSDVELPASDAFVDELQTATDIVVGRADPGPLSSSSARDSLELCWREVESMRSGQVVRIARP